jgi:hypothetical protein
MKRADHAAVMKLPLAQRSAAMNAHTAERAERACHIANGVRVVGHHDFADGIARKVRELSNGDRRHAFIPPAVYTADRFFTDD